MSKDYYKILGVEKNATQEEIKKAFRKAAHKYHPDKGEGDETKFKEANEAYQVLSNPQKRQQYDQFGSNFDQSGFAGGQGPFGGGGFDFSGFQNAQGFSDIDIDEIFGDFFGGFGRRTGRGRQRSEGRDLEIGLEIDFIEAALGAHKEINLQKQVVCETCSGNGAQPGSKVETCAGCNGSGAKTHVRQTFLGAMQSQTVCDECEGQGTIIKEKCATCSGSGVETKQQNIAIDIPGGVETGTKLRIEGAGDAGKRGARAGDLFVRISVKQHSAFKRDQETVLSKETIPFSMATLGGKTMIDTVDGEVSLKIPAGTKSGEQFRLRGKGAKKVGLGRRGDHVVTIAVAVPDKLTSEQKKLIKKLEDLGL